MPQSKTFRGATVTEALAKVKSELGPSAVILTTRSFRAGAVLGMGGSPVVEIDAAPPSTPSRSLRGALARMHEDVPTRRNPVAVPAPAPEPSPSADSPRSRAHRLAPLPVSTSPQTPEAAEALRDEIASIKKMVGQLLRCSSQSSARVSRSRHGVTETPVFENGSLPEPLFAHYTRLLDADVDVNVAQTVIASARDAIDPASLSDARAVRTAVLAALSTYIPTAPLPLPAPSDRPQVIAMIGPTGVGKTTTIAKLAADHALRHGRKVALITADTYRIGAVDQLRAYAEIIGVPLEVAGDARSMAGAISCLSSAQIILLDTAGRSPADDARLDELATILEAARPDHRLLVLSASASPNAIERAHRRFVSFSPDRVVLSKLDEASSLGVIVNTPAATSLPLAYVTTGQDVPDFILSADPAHLAASVLDGELPR